MQRPLRIAIAAAVVLAILAFMTTYTVRFTEKAVVTTFGKANAESVKSEPGLGFKWPYPVQSVTKYDTRARYAETRSETVALADNRQVILQTYLVWRIDDPLKFFQSYGNAGAREADHVRQAEETLRAKTRAALAEASRYRLGDLLSVTDKGSKLPELEARVLEAVRGAGLSSSGIAAELVGVHSLELPESVTEQVYKQMQANTQRISGAETKRGEVEAASINSQSTADRNKIMSFAQRLADSIRSQGDAESARYLAMQKEDPELAVFLQNLRFMREAVAQRGTTLVLPSSMPGFHLLNPSVIERLNRGQIPAPGPARDATVGGAGEAGGAEVRK